MTKADILAILKSDLDIAGATTSKDPLLGNLIDTSQAAISREGISLSDPLTTEEGTLVEMYAAFLYRRRKDPTATMPHSLRYLLNNMLVAQKAAPDEQ